MDLILPLKRKWFEQIQQGIKPFEYRLKTEYWRRRLEGKSYTNVIFTLGYPRRNDETRRIKKPYAGYEIQTVICDEWSNQPQEVYAIHVMQPANR
ncbi:ASCH domain-containing protein [Cellvibrio mixtus]|uniref:ASCH domain-containing protein n=1 Tax=Cellvibrio mixtus TaxID=39650 RepID=UPI000A9AD7CA|nr:ASCH domain-containing protein [Cellvibrio mixtus]